MYKSVFLLFMFFYCAFSQEEKEKALSIQFLRGSIIPHKDDMPHHINGQPEGILATYFFKTNGEKEWQQLYNFPDYGAYFLYQNFESNILGENYAIGGFYNFYFLNRKLKVFMAQGIAITSNPYNRETNSKNKAFGSRILGNTNFGLSYIEEEVFKNVGFEIGILYTHFSNGRFKSPNSGINTYSLQLGIQYNLNTAKPKVMDSLITKIEKSKIGYAIILRGGINESSIIGMGQKPFFHVSAMADKRINKKSSLQLGAEVFFTESQKDLIRFYSVAFPNKNVDSSTDYKRAALFVGHEFHINKLGIETQLGYYVYKPFKTDISIYNRLGLKYYISKKWFTGISLKTHLFLAEASEAFVGYRW